MTEQEIAAALLRHEPYHSVSRGRGRPFWCWMYAANRQDRCVLPLAVFNELAYNRSFCHCGDSDGVVMYHSPEAAYADLANAYRLAYPARIS